jgi:hypothetical protein
MPSEDFIDVRVYLDGEVAREYEVPGKTDTSRNITRYIEAEAGQRWRVRVRVLHGFRLHWAKHLSAGVYWDDSDAGRLGWIKTKNIASRRGIVQEEYTVMDDGSMDIRDEATGQWFKSYHTIGALGTGMVYHCCTSPWH